MAKKIKPKSLLETSVKNTEYTNETTSNAVKTESPNLINSHFTNEEREKLDKYDALEQNVMELLAKNEVLQAKLENYMLAENSLDNTNKMITSLTNENQQLHSEVNELKNKAQVQAKAIVNLQNDNKALREENDQYLVKISELTFENANLTCQLDEVTKSIKSNSDMVVNQNEFKPVKTPQIDNSRLGEPFRNPYNPYANNGYGSW